MRPNQIEICGPSNGLHYIVEMVQVYIT